MDSETHSPERTHHSEAGSSSSGDTDGYLTPEEYPEGEHVPLTHSLDEETREALDEANELKAEGTEYFRAEKWVEALHAYTRGLARLPPRKDIPRLDKGKRKVNDESGTDGSESPEEGSHSVVDGGIPEVSLSELEKECAKARSVLNGNIGACHVKLKEHKDAVVACTQALLDDPQYVKALHRRATSNEFISTWSSLTAAEEDYNTLIPLLPASSPLLPQARLALQRIKPQREAAQKAEMGEMMDKLKGLGNSLLGNFGLSTDNFKFEPNGQGGYSMNFVR